MAEVYASVATAKRGGQTIFKSPRKEVYDQLSTARRSASRHWSATTERDGDRLISTFLVEVIGSMVVIHERPAGGDWKVYRRQAGEALPPHLDRAVAELGVDLTPEQQPMPEFLTINGVLYRREI